MKKDKKAKALIVGFGHLANFIYTALDEHWDVFGTSRAWNPSSKLPIEKHQFYSIGDSVETLSKEAWDWVIFCIPPRENYCEALREWDKTLDPNCRWIFVSSTSVYGPGFSDENSSLVADTRGQEILLEIEVFLKSLSRKLVVLRPGGLVDRKRDPKNFFKNTKEVKAANDFINLVHSEDVASFMAFAMSKALEGSYNLVGQNNCTKKEFYSLLIPDLKFQINVGVSREISNKRSLDVGFSYTYSDLISYFQQIADSP